MQFFHKKQPKEPQNIDEVLARFKELQNECRTLRAEINNLKEKNRFNVNKVGVVRFNPFGELGSNQSFSLALLDGNGCGAVVTSLFTREANRVYAKPIKNGESEFKLTNEEKEAIQLAQGQVNSKIQSSNNK